MMAVIAANRSDTIYMAGGTVLNEDWFCLAAGQATAPSGVPRTGSPLTIPLQLDTCRCHWGLRGAEILRADTLDLPGAALTGRVRWMSGASC